MDITEHRQKVINRYKWFKAQGICPTCKWRPHAPGHVLCEACMKPKKAVGIVFKSPGEPTRWELIMDDLGAGKPYGEVAKKYKTSVGTIKVYDRVRLGVMPGPRKKLACPPEMGVVEAYEQGFGIAEISRGKKITENEVSWILEQAGIAKRGTRKLHMPTPEELDEIEAEYLARGSINKISRRHDMSVYRVLRYMELRGVLRPQGKACNVTKEQWEQAAEDYLAGMTMAEIGKRFGYGASAISRHLQRMGITVRPRSERSRLMRKKLKEQKEGAKE